VRVLDLFSGIGGFSLGLERAGMRTVQFVEIDEFCRHVLWDHWPGVPCHDDIRTFHAPAGFADVICGGFPCQDISVAGKGAGLAGARSGLWSEYARLISEVRPRYVIVENVAALLSRGLEQVLGDLASIGYDAEWHCIPASYVGAPHRRVRVWFVAYPGERGHGRLLQPLSELGSGPETDTGGDGEARPMAYPDDPGLQGRHGEVLRECAPERPARQGGASVPNAHGEPQGRSTESWRERGQWESEPDVGRVAHGVPSRVDRLRALGNAVVPQVVEVIGRAIMEHAHG
jgi:DNA (cytosine-5)-methyltransferase 1